MRRILLGLAVVLAVGSFATGARAQIVNNGVIDPFSVYYGWYIPNQIYQAAIPRPEDTVRAYSAARSNVPSPPMAITISIGSGTSSGSSRFNPSSRLSSDEATRSMPASASRAATFRAVMSTSKRPVCATRSMRRWVTTTVQPARRRSRPRPR